MGVEPCGAVVWGYAPNGDRKGAGERVMGLTGRADVLSSSGHSAVFVSPPHSMEGTAHA